MNKTFTTWTIDGKPAPWSSEVAYAAIDAVLPVEKYYVHRDNEKPKVVVAFKVIVGDDKISCCCEMLNDEPLDTAEKRTQDFRTEIIKAWAATLGNT